MPAVESDSDCEEDVYLADAAKDKLQSPTVLKGKGLPAPRDWQHRGRARQIVLHIVRQSLQCVDGERWASTSKPHLCMSLPDEDAVHDHEKGIAAA